jgi:hypothetical protein
MIDNDLDKDQDETIQHFARKKREATNSKGLIVAIVIIMIAIAALYLVLI